MPASIDLNILFDRSESIRQSISDVKFTLVLTICLVVLVIFLFLRNVWATIIPSLAVPMSLFGTFAVMYVLGFTMDNLSMMAATVYLFDAIPKGFIPSEDTGQINATTEAAQDISFDSMVKHQQEAAQFIQQDPNVEAFMSSVGAGGPNSTSNNGRFLIRLKP